MERREERKAGRRTVGVVQMGWRVSMMIRVSLWGGNVSDWVLLIEGKKGECNFLTASKIPEPPSALLRAFSVELSQHA